MTKKVIICSGGTGGHLFPAKVISHALLAYKNIQVTLMADKRVALHTANWDKKINLTTLIAAPFSGKNILQKLKFLVYLFLGVVQCSYYFIKKRPQVIISFGGYTTVAPLIAAVILKIPIILHEQNALAGRTNRIFAKAAAKIITSFKNTEKLEQYKSKIIYLGLPINELFLKLREQLKPVAPKSQYTILILGGSQGAKVFGVNIPEGFNLLPVNIQNKIIVYHQCRPELIVPVKELWNKTKVAVEISHFFNNVPELMYNSDLIISRSGASTVAEINCLGKMAVYVPYKFATDNHQYYNAKAMANQKAAWLIKEEDFTSLRVSEIVLKLLEKDNGFSFYAKGAKLQYNKDTTKSFISVILSFLKE